MEGLFALKLRVIAEYWQPIWKTAYLSKKSVKYWAKQCQ